MVNGRHPDLIGFNGIAGNGGASRVEKEKDSVLLFVNGVSDYRGRCFFISFFSLTGRYNCVTLGDNFPFVEKEII